MKRTFWGVILILVGALALVQEGLDINLGLSFWPVVLTLAGLAILWSSFRKTSWFGLALGLYVTAMGVFEMAYDAGYTYISGHDIFSNGWPLLLVAIGISIIFGKRPWWSSHMVRCNGKGINSGNVGTVIGDFRYGYDNWTLDKDLNVDHGIGDVKLDLTTATIADGVHTITAKVGIGDVVIRVPDNVTVRAEGHVGAGELLILGERRSGLGNNLAKQVVVEGSPVELNIIANLGMGEIKIVQQPARTVRIN